MLDFRIQLAGNLYVRSRQGGIVRELLMSSRCDSLRMSPSFLGGLSGFAEVCRASYPPRGRPSVPLECPLEGSGWDGENSISKVD